MATPSSLEGIVGFAVQSAQGTPATAFNTMKMLRFTWTPDVIGDEEGEPEIGGSMDVAAALRYGNQGATFTGEVRARPGHLGFILRAFGMSADDGKFIIYPGVNDAIAVNEDSGGFETVNILTGTGATAAAFTPYTASALATHLQTVLNAATTLSGTYTVAVATDKFTISATGLTTLVLGWTQTGCNIGALLGYDTSADDSGSLSYEADYTSDWCVKHVFRPIAAQTNFPWITIYDAMDAGTTLRTLLYDARVRSITINAEANNVVRLTFEGRALVFGDATGSETFTAENVLVTEPSTSKGELYFPAAAYQMQRLSCEFNWNENVIPALTYDSPVDLVAGRRSARGTADVMLGSEASAALFRKTYYGGGSGTSPSVDITQQMLHVFMQSGQAIVNAGAGVTEYYAMRIHSEETRLLTYPLEKSGDNPISGGLTFQIYKGSTAWCIVLENNLATGYYD